MNNNMKQYQRKSWQALSMIFAMCLALVGAASLSACSDDDPHFTVSEDDYPRILNTDLSDKTIDRKTPLQMEIKVTPMHYTTVTWLLDDVQIAEGSTIDQFLPVGSHVLKIVATTTKGKSTWRSINIVVRPAADDPSVGTNASELWVAPGETTEIHGCAHLDQVVTILVGGKNAHFEVLDEGTTLRLTAPQDLANGDYDITLIDKDGVEFAGGKIKVTTEAKPSMETTLWEGSFAVTWGTPFDALKDDMVNLVHAGTIVRAYVTGAGQGSMTTAWWNNILTGKGDPDRGDIMIDGDQVLEYTLTETSMALMNEQNGFLIVGDGYTILKVTAEQ